MENEGIFKGRIPYNKRERAFAEQWEIENKQSRTLDKLTLASTDRDIEVAATIIQWLGSNVGMAFLSAAMKREPEIKEWLLGRDV
jgi:hypothetical protein